MRTMLTDAGERRRCLFRASALTPYGEAVDADRASTSTRTRRAADLGRDVDERIEYLELFRATKHAEVDAAVDAQIFRVLGSG